MKRINLLKECINTRLSFSRVSGGILWFDWPLSQDPGVAFKPLADHHFVKYFGAAQVEEKGHCIAG